MPSILVSPVADSVTILPAPHLFSWRPLNGLQKMMLRWETIQPLNAIHLLTIAGNPDTGEVRRAVKIAVQRHIPGPVLFSDCQNQFRCLAAAEHNCQLEISVHDESTASENLQQKLLHHELNTPFPNTAAWPYRFHAVLASNNTWTLQIAYRHALQDGSSTMALARTILRSLRNLPTSAPLGLADNLFGDIPAFHNNGSPLQMAPAILKEIITGLTSRRIRPRWNPPDQFVTGLDSAGICVAEALANARRQKVKLQDVLLAATHEAMQQISVPHGLRNRIGLYTPVDLRREAVPPVPEACGQILGGYTLRFQCRKTPFAELVQQFAAETQRIKQSGYHRLYERHVNFMSFIWDRLPNWGNEVAGPFLAPITAALSNLNSNEFMTEELQCGQLLNYSRFTGTGIMTSLMLGMTTCGNSLNLSTTHHSMLYSEAEMTEVRRHIQSRLLGLDPARQ